MSQPGAGQFFQEIRVINSLQMRPEERQWLAQPPHDPQPVEVLLYLGCNVFRTPHMARTIIDIFHQLGVNFAAVGDAAYCCGAPYRAQGPDVARRVAERSAEHFAAFRPKTVAMWCPGCLAYYQDTLRMSAPYRTLHITEFLAERVDELPLTRQVACRAALHHHSTGRPQTDREAAGAQRLLQAVPGLDLVDIGSDPRLGDACTPAVQQRLGKVEWEAAVAAQMERAAALKVEVLATLYHGCHRFLASYQARYPFAVEHYLSLVGRAMGVEHEDLYRKYLLWGDADRILEDAAPRLAANSIPVEAARPVVQRIFSGRPRA